MKPIRLVQIKQPSDLKFPGLDTQFEYYDGTLQSVSVTDATGNRVVFAAGQYSGMRVMVPAPPPTKEVAVVTGTVRDIGTKIEEQFPDSFTAERRAAELRQSGVCVDVNVTTKEVPAEEGE